MDEQLRSIDEYTLLHDDLYTDKTGDLYHRTVDVSRDGQREYAYRNYAWVDTLIDGTETLETVDLRFLVDEPTFHKTTDPDSTDRMEHYQDKNRSYFIVINADGGTLQEE